MLYELPFELDSKVIVKAISVDPQSEKKSAVATREFDIPTTSFKVAFPLDQTVHRMFDDNGFTVCYLNENKSYIELDLNENMNISGIRYLPSQVRDADQHIANYEVCVDGRLVHRGEFSNISNNPIEQVVRFEPTNGKHVRFVATRFTNDASQGAVAEFSVITD